MKKLLILLAALGGILLFSGCESKVWKTVDGVIVFDTPAREPGQKSVLGLKTAPMETVRVGFIGLGMRGPGAVERFTHLDGVEIKALCDLYPERVDSAQAILVRRGFPEAAPYSGEEGWKQLCERDDIDLVYIVTPWQLHVPMAVYAMEHGKHVAVEVPAATSLEECWQLVNTAEKTQRHCMMLENCVYDFFELRTLRGHSPCRRCVYPRPRRFLGLLSGQLASEIQPGSPRRRLRHARPRSRLPAARHPPRRQDELPGGDGHPLGQRAKTRPREAGR